MAAHLTDWLHLFFRWFHIIVGAAWIGTSFYFNWLNNSLRPPAEPRKGIAGHLMAVHGGAFYEVLKYKGAPEKLPETLHWFKWEAYLTWITGVSLLVVVYYFNARGYLIDPSLTELDPWQAVGIGIGTLAFSWLSYDALCRSPLANMPGLFAVLGFALATLVAWGLTEVFSDRAAYIHVGAAIGTIMAGNVFFVIIPSQRYMVNALLDGKEPDTTKGREGALRSLHNNYLTLPVLFIMISSHFPMTYGHTYNWLILAALSLIGATVRHWFNLRGQGHRNVWILPMAALAMIALALVSAPRSVSSQNEKGVALTPVPFSEVSTIITHRCLPCHSKNPTHPSFPAAPAGIMYDTPEQVRAQREKIHSAAVVNKIMPLGNLTQITEEERSKLGLWIEQGAELP